VLRKVQGDGTVVTIAGQYGVAGSGGEGGPAADLWLSSPDGVAVDNNGNIFLANKADFQVYMITPGGIVLPVAGEGTSSQDSEIANDAGGVPAPSYNIRLRTPQGLAVDNQGDMFIADSSGNRVERIPYAAPAACVDSNGNLINSGWPLATAIPKPCTQGNLAFVMNRVAGSLTNADDDFMFDYTAPASATAAANTVNLSFPTGVAVDPKGNVVFTDTANNLIRVAVCPHGQVGCSN